MRTHLVNRLLLILVLAAALFLMALHKASPAPAVSVCKEDDAAPLGAGGHRLWESLSHQFVSVMAY